VRSAPAGRRSLFRHLRTPRVGGDRPGLNDAARLDRAGDGLRPNTRRPVRSDLRRPVHYVDGRGFARNRRAGCKKAAAHHDGCTKHPRPNHGVTFAPVPAEQQRSGARPWNRSVGSPPPPARSCRPLARRLSCKPERRRLARAMIRPLNADTAAAPTLPSRLDLIVPIFPLLARPRRARIALGQKGDRATPLPVSSCGTAARPFRLGVDH
jgi:hypothetical protein